MRCRGGSERRAVGEHRAVDDRDLEVAPMSCARLGAARRWPTASAAPCTWFTIATRRYGQKSSTRPFAHFGQTLAIASAAASSAAEARPGASTTPAAPRGRNRCRTGRRTRPASCCAARPPGRRRRLDVFPAPDHGHHQSSRRGPGREGCSRWREIGAQTVSACTRRSSDSWKSGSSVDPAEAQGRVVEHRVRRPRRRAGRFELGGGDRLHPMRDRGRRPRAPRRTNSYQLTAPWLVTWNVPGRRSTARRGSSCEVVGEGRVPALVVHEGERRRLGRARIVFTMLAPCGPHTHAVRTIVRAGSDLDLATELRAPVDRLRVGRVPLDVRPALVPRRRSRCRRARTCAPPFAAASVTQRTPSALMRHARSGSASQASTAVHAPALMTTSGLRAGDRLRDRVAVAEVERARGRARSPRRPTVVQWRTSSRPSWPAAPVMRIRMAPSAPLLQRFATTTRCRGTRPPSPSSASSSVRCFASRAR